MLCKPEARKRALAYRRALPPETYRLFDHKVSEYAHDILHLVQNHFSCSAQGLRDLAFAAYLPQNYEPGSRTLLQIFRDHGLQVYCPLVNMANAHPTANNAKSKILDWALYDGKERLGHWNIPEPPPPYLKIKRPFHVMIIPALSIDAQGNRLGRGGGFYDRSLSICTMPETLLLGMCFTTELLSENHDLAWKSDPWDVPMDYTLSEKKGLSSINLLD